MLKKQNYFLLTIMFLISIFYSQKSFSQAEFQYELLGGLNYYSGLEEKSLAPNTATLVRFTAGTAKQGILRWSANLTLISSSGTAKFDDQGTQRELSYALTGGEFNFGFKFLPLGSFKHLPVQPYLIATGAVQIDSFTFGTEETTSAKFPKTESGQFFGYNIGAGADIFLGDKWGLVVYYEQSKIGGTLAQKEFFTDSNRIMAGFFFK
jgi:hypothetical protein